MSFKPQKGDLFYPVANGRLQPQVFRCEGSDEGCLVGTRVWPGQPPTASHPTLFPLKVYTFHPVGPEVVSGLGITSRPATEDSDLTVAKVQIATIFQKLIELRGSIDAYDKEMDDDEGQGHNARPPEGDDYNDLHAMVNATLSALGIPLRGYGQR